MEENCTIFPVEGKRQVKDEETEITYIIYAVDADDKGRDDDIDLVMEQDTVRIQTIQESGWNLNDLTIRVLKSSV